MTTLNTIIEEKIKEFDDLYIHNNVWKSDDETLAYAPIEGMRQWIHDTLTTAMQRAYEAGQSEERAKIREEFIQMIELQRQKKISDNKDITDGWDMALLNLRSAFDYPDAVLAKLTPDKTV